MIELRQLIGKRRGKDYCVETIRHPVDEILRDGRRIGFIARHTGAPIVFAQPLAKEEHGDVVQAVAALREQAGEFGPPSGMTTAPPYIEPVDTEPIEEEQDDG